MTLKECETCPVSGQTYRDERINFWTHLFGLVLSIIGSIFLLYTANLCCNTLMKFGIVVYGLSLCLLFSASTLYHGWKNNPSFKRILRIIDHSCIFLLIAGTYTPLMLGPILNEGGLYLLIIEWSIAVLGIIVKIFATHKFKLISTLAYLGMGWLVIFTWPTIVSNLSLSSVNFIILGGVLYSLGTIFYLWKSLPHQHAIWHLFVLGGSISHYFAVYEMLRFSIPKV